MPEQRATFAEKLEHALADARAANLPFPWAHTLSSFCDELAALATARSARVWWTSQVLTERGTVYLLVDLHAQTFTQKGSMTAMAYYPGDRVDVRVAPGTEIPGAKDSVLGGMVSLPVTVEDAVVEDALASLLRHPAFHACFGFLGLGLPVSPAPAT